MPKNIIIHTTEVNGDGIGDLVYLLHWLKLFDKYYKGSAEQKLLLIAAKPDEISDFLRSLAIAEPTHPIFKYFSVTDQRLHPIVVNKIKQGEIRRSQRPNAIILQDVFPDVQGNDHVTLVCISTDWNQYQKTAARSSAPVDRYFGIFEFDAYLARPTEKSILRSSLGLESNDFGLLHDITDVDNTKSLEPLFAQLSADIKKQIFLDSNVTFTMAQEFLSNVPIVFAYIAPFYLHEALKAALASPIIQDAIAADKKPLFFLSGSMDTRDLPQSILEAAKTNQIRIIRTWLKQSDYLAVKALFMHENTRSILIPAGDNTLTECIKAGKFPLYAHKPMVGETEFQFNFKCGIFKSMLNILTKHGVKLGWNKHPGFSACCKTLTYLARKPWNSDIRKHYQGMHENITEDMLAFFSTILAPYLMDNYAFERKTLPGLLRLIQTAPAVERSTEVSATITAQFDTTRQTPSTKSAASSTVPLADQSAKTAFAGLRRGFLAG